MRSMLLHSHVDKAAGRPREMFRDAGMQISMDCKYLLSFRRLTDFDRICMRAYHDS